MLFYSSISCSFWNTFDGGDHIKWKCHPFLFPFLWVLRKFLLQWAYLREYLPQTSVQDSVKHYICELQAFCLFSESNTLYTTQTIFISWGLPISASKEVSSFAGLHVCLAPGASSWHLLELFDSGVKGFLCAEEWPGGGEAPPGFSYCSLLITIAWLWSSTLLWADKLQLLL